MPQQGSMSHALGNIAGPLSSRRLAPHPRRQAAASLQMWILLQAQARAPLAQEPQPQQLQAVQA